MSEFGRQLARAINEHQGDLSYVSDIRDENGCMLIDLTLDRPAFFCREAIDSWMFDCVLHAHAHCDSEEFALPIYRGVDAQSAARALANGIDVFPLDAHWYGSSLEKALEYGGDYPQVLIIDGRAAERTQRQVSATAAQADHDAARAWAGSDGFAVRGGWMRYSRLPETDSRRGSDYEVAHAWFIPGDPKSALLGIISCKPSIGAAISHTPHARS